jgi:hypothetical protein
MRCKACNVNLNDFEATRKYVGRQEYVDLCSTCFATIELDTEIREDLLLDEDCYTIDEELWDEIYGNDED